MQTPIPPPHESAAGVPVPLRALVVEDDADTRANLCDILELDDWHVETAGTVREVLERSDWSEIVVAILDRRLPDGQAEQFLPEIRRRAPQTAVIVVTGYADLNDAILALRHGAADYLLKPINPDALRASISRIVQQKQISQQLHDSQALLREQRDFAESLIQTAPMIVLLCDTDGRIVRFNPYFEELTHFTIDQVRGTTWELAFVAPADRESHRGLFGRALADGPLDWTSSIVTRSGETRRVRWSSKTLCDAAGRTVGLLACGQDVTGLEEAQRRVVQSERLAAIGQMMTGLAHESGNALQRSKACLEMLALEVEDRPAALDLIARVQRAHDHLWTLYEEVRQYAAPINLRTEKSDLRQTWRETWEDLADAHGPRNIRLQEDLGGVDPTCVVDRFAIGQVWRNILENALQVVAAGTTITIRCADTLLEGRAAVRICLADLGPGMNADQRKRVFEPFFTTKTKGTGLGMAIAQRIVSSHGGTIAVADRDGPGAEFIVVLPREPHESALENCRSGR